MPYSYSQYGTHKQCGARYKYRYIDRLPEEKNVYAQRGTNFHDMVEQYLLGNLTELPPPIDFYKDWLSGIKDIEGIKPEHKVSLTPDWTLTEWDDPEAYLRAVIDLYVPPQDGYLQMYEFKTGKEYPDHVYQRNLYGMLGLLLHPEINSVTVTGVYLDQRKTRQNEYFQDMVDEYKALWRRQFEALANPASHIPNPSYTCKYCSFSRDKGGPCPF